MAWAKMKTAIALTAGMLLTTGAATFVVGQIVKYEWSILGVNDSWRTRFTMISRPAMLSALEKIPAQVMILPTIYPDWGSIIGWDKAHRLAGRNSSLTNLLSYAYGMRTTRMVFLGPTAGGKYDFIANLPQGSEEAFREKIKTQFGLVAHKAVITNDVWVLKVSDSEKLNLLISKKTSANFEFKQIENRFVWVVEGNSAAELASVLEGGFVQAPVMDRTGLSGRYDLNLQFDLTNVIPSVVIQLHRVGLELVPSREPVEMLVVEKVK